MKANEEDSRMLVGMALCSKQTGTQNDWTTDWKLLLTSDLGATQLYFEPKIRHKITPFHMAIAEGCPVDIMGEMLHKYPQLVHCTTDGGDLPLHYAVASHAYNAVHLLIKKDPRASQSLQHVSRANGAFGNQVLALHVAIATEAPADIVSLLLECCPSTSLMKDGAGNSPIGMIKKRYDGSSFYKVTKSLMKARGKETKKLMLLSRSIDGDSVATGDSSIGVSKSFQSFCNTVNSGAPDSDVERTNDHITFGNRKKGKASVALEKKSHNATTGNAGLVSQTGVDYAKKTPRSSSILDYEARLVARTDHAASRTNSAPVAPADRSRARRTRQSLDDLFEKGRNEDASRQSRQELDELSNIESKQSRDQSIDGPLLKRFEENSLSKKTAQASKRSCQYSSDALIDSKKLDSKVSTDRGSSRRKSASVQLHRSPRSLRSTRRISLLDIDATASIVSLRPASAIEGKQPSPRRQPHKKNSNKGKRSKLLETHSPRSANPSRTGLKKLSSRGSTSTTLRSTRASTKTRESKDRNGEKSILHSVRDQMWLENGGPLKEAQDWKEYRATKRDAMPDSTPLRISRSVTPTSMSTSRSLNSETTGESTKSILRLPKNLPGKAEDRWTQVLEEGLKDLSMSMPDTTPSRRRSAAPTALRSANCFSRNKIMLGTSCDIHLVEDKNMKGRRQQQRRRSSAPQQSSEPSFAKLIDALSPPPQEIPSKSKSDRKLRGVDRTQEPEKDLSSNLENENQIESKFSSTPHETERVELSIQDLASTLKESSTRRLKEKMASSRRLHHGDKLSRSSRKQVGIDSTSSKSCTKESTSSMPEDSNHDENESTTTTSARQATVEERSIHKRCYTTDSSTGATKADNSSCTKQKKKLRFQTPPATIMQPRRVSASDDDCSDSPMPCMMSAMI